MNVIARLEYELAHYDSAVHRFNHYSTKTPPLGRADWGYIYACIQRIIHTRKCLFLFAVSITFRPARSPGFFTCNGYLDKKETICNSFFILFCFYSLFFFSFFFHFTFVLQKVIEEGSLCGVVVNDIGLVWFLCLMAYQPSLVI